MFLNIHLPDSALQLEVDRLLETSERNGLFDTIVSQANACNVTPQMALAVAILETGIRNKESSDGRYRGPFALDVQRFSSVKGKQWQKNPLGSVLEACRSLSGHLAWARQEFGNRKDTVVMAAAAFDVSRSAVAGGILSCDNPDRYSTNQSYGSQVERVSGMVSKYVARKVALENLDETD